MPKKLERRLEREASAKHLSGKRRGAYVYGTLARIEAKKRKRPRSSKTRKR